MTEMGMAALAGVMEADAERVVGYRKGGHQQGRRLGHWGYTDTPFPYDGREVVLPRPRVRTVDKKREVPLPSVTHFQSLDAMSTRVVDQIPLGVSTRGYEASLGTAADGLRTKGAKKSRVSEVFVEETRWRMKDRLAEKLDGLDLVAMLLDGVHVAQHAIAVGLGISRDGHKHITGLRQGSTENATLCTELLQDLVGHGLKGIEGLLGGEGPSCSTCRFGRTLTVVASSLASLLRILGRYPGCLDARDPSRAKARRSKGQVTRPSMRHPLR